MTDNQRFEEQHIVERLPNGDVIVEAQGRSDFFVIQTLLRYRGNAELLWPERLRGQMIEEVRKLAALYQQTEAGSVTVDPTDEGSCADDRGPSPNHPKKPG